MSDSPTMRWKAASAWYAARPKREQLILAFAGLALVWALTDALWLSPATQAFKSQFNALSQKQAELDQLDAQRTALKESLRLRDAELRRDTETARQQLADISGQLAEFEKALVPARQMPDFLRSLLPGAGVDIVALRTLAPTPLILRGAAKDGKDTAANAGAAAANIYKHGIEITLAGNYDALLNYLSRLEKSPQKVLWGRLELKVEKHPRNELVLVLYTLSLDPSWLVV
ncbi:MAG TPA: hypothetical protein VFH22_14265 [Rhodocyclaceae bacterium]|nr:hypothetical protein [Rhodocyclaceae bacterium]